MLFLLFSLSIFSSSLKDDEHYSSDSFFKNSDPMSTLNDSDNTSMIVQNITFVDGGYIFGLTSGENINVLENEINNYQFVYDQVNISLIKSSNSVSEINLTFANLHENNAFIIVDRSFNDDSKALPINLFGDLYIISDSSVIPFNFDHASLIDIDYSNDLRLVEITSPIIVSPQKSLSLSANNDHSLIQFDSITLSNQCTLSSNSESIQVKSLTIQENANATIDHVYFNKIEGTISASGNSYVSIPSPNISLATLNIDYTIGESIPIFQINSFSNFFYAINITVKDNANAYDVSKLNGMKHSLIKPSDSTNGKCENVISLITFNPSKLFINNKTQTVTFGVDCEENVLYTTISISDYDPSDEDEDDEDENGGISSKKLGIILGVCCGVIIVVVIIAVSCYLKRTYKEGDSDIIQQELNPDGENLDSLNIV